MINYKQGKQLGKTYLYARMPYISVKIQAYKHSACKDYIDIVSLDHSKIDYYKVRINTTFVGLYITKSAAMLAVTKELKQIGQ